MKRDMDLIRKILLHAEESPDGYARDEMDCGDYYPETVSFHIWLLSDAGLVVGHECTHLGSSGPQAYLSHLTWQGYEFLDLIRSQSVWDKVKAKASAVGGASLPVLAELAASYVKEQIGLK